MLPLKEDSVLYSDSPNALNLAHERSLRRGEQKTGLGGGEKDKKLEGNTL